MRRLPLLLIALFSLFGCSKPETETTQVTTPPMEGVGDPGVLPSAAAGGMAPVTNPGAVEGAGGGGVGMAAKDMARGVAGQSPASSLDQGFDDSSD